MGNSTAKPKPNRKGWGAIAIDVLPIHFLTYFFNWLTVTLTVDLTVPLTVNLTVSLTVKLTIGLTPGYGMVMVMVKE